MKQKRTMTELDRVSAFLPMHLLHDTGVADILACYQTATDGWQQCAAFAEALAASPRTALWGLLQALLDGEARRAFSDDGRCSSIAQDLIDAVEDELWRRRQCTQR